ncbi:uncharacterized protein LOC144621324 [Crassostrea virginica]
MKNVCPICFESFKTPRYLPCSHTFCHNCLSSYILSTCKSKENPVGFPCPFCKHFVPGPSSPRKPEKWTELFPIDKVVQSMCEKNDRFCDACARVNEVEVATDWCESCLESLCVVCAKSHKRNAVSQYHKVTPIKDFSKTHLPIERGVFCKDHCLPAKYMCVDHEELCCTECVCTNHRKCNRVEEIEKAAEHLIQSGTLQNLTQAILQLKDILLKAKSDGEATMKYIDQSSDKILKESSDVRDKLVRHIHALVETHQDMLTQKAEEEKERLAKFVDTVIDMELLMAQHSQTLTATGKTLPSVLVQDYFNIKNQFKQITGMGLYKPCVKLHSNASKQLSTILDTLRLEDVRVETKLIPIGCIDLTCANMKMVCELPESSGYVSGGCFLDNGDIVLADRNSKHCLYYRNKNLLRKISLRGTPQDMIFRKPSELLISTNANSKGYIEHYDLDELQKFPNVQENQTFVYHLAISSEFIYVACSTFILKLDHKGNTVGKITVDSLTYSVAVNKQQEIISSSCSTDNVTVMNQAGLRMYSYSHENLKYPFSLHVNISGNIFVAGETSNNIHVLTPSAELLKIFEVASPRCIRFKENSYICIVGSNKGTSKVYEFLPNGLEL